jgi:hypothetical protein
MSSAARRNRQTLGILAVGVLLVAAAVWWWAPWEDASPEPRVAGSEARTSTSVEEGKARGVDATEPARAQADDESNPVTGEEIRAIKSELSAARDVLHEIEARHVNHVSQQDGETWHLEHVYLAALTREDLDPVYTHLSKAGRAFLAGSGAAQMFRKEADKFLADLAKLPAKHAMRKLDKTTGNSAYTLTLLSEDSSVTVGPGGGVEIRGAVAASGGALAKPEEVAHLFRKESR